MRGNAIGLNNNVAGHTNKRLETAVDAQTPGSQYAILNIIELNIKLITRYYNKQKNADLWTSFTKIILIIYWSHIHSIFRLRGIAKTRAWRSLILSKSRRGSTVRRVGSQRWRVLGWDRGWSVPDRERSQRLLRRTRRRKALDSIHLTTT